MAGATQDERGEISPPPASDHNQVGSLLVRILNQYIRWIPLQIDPLDGLGAPVEDWFDPLPYICPLSDGEIIADRRQPAHGSEDGSGHMGDEHDLYNGIQLLGQGSGTANCYFTRPGIVDPDNDDHAGHCSGG
jgi:hypothetical protein